MSIALQPPRITDEVEVSKLPRNVVAQADYQAALESAREVLAIESEALQQVRASLGDAFIEAVKLIASIKGRVVVTGMGKSGHVARKIAATLASTGTPAMFVHPGEASHGDLGMVTKDDAVLALSNSGEVTELRDITLFARRFHIPLIAMTGRAESTLATTADVALVLPKVQEACAIGPAPTTSTTCMLALGDAIAVALLRLAGFTAGDYAVFHPGGRLGSRLLRVDQLMRTGEDLPLAAPDALLREAVLTMTRKCLGCIAVVEQDGTLNGIITDGDLRRHMRNDLLDMTVADVMTPTPLTIGAKALAVEALALMNDKSRTVLLVVEGPRLIGAIHLHDCLRAGIA